MKHYEELQNGSDIRGIAMENEEGYPVNLTEEAVRCLSIGFTEWLRQSTGKQEVKIAVGRDSRLSGPALSKAIIEGINAAGGSCTDFGLASTPAMFMATVLPPIEADGSIMVTASHLPWYRNGMKFFTKNGGLEKSDIAKVIALAEGADSKAPFDSSTDSYDFMENYCGHLRKKIIAGAGKGTDKPLSGLHIIVDAGNGAGGFFAGRVLEPLGADISGSQFLEPDGHFPNHMPNPENKEAAKAIQDATLSSHADLGIIFDTDVDRAGAVLSDGRTLTRNALIAVLSRIAVNEHPGTTIVTDSVTSTGLHEFIEGMGGVHRRFKRGYRNVINEAIRLNKEGVRSDLAIETSGHGAFMENYFLDDGAYLMVKLLIEMGKGNSLESLISGLKEPLESLEIRIRVNTSEKSPSDIMERALSHVSEAVSKQAGWTPEKENFEGLRINCDSSHGNGWFLIRKSLHEPIMPLNIESDSEGGAETIKNALKAILEETEGLDLSCL